MHFDLADDLQAKFKTILQQGVFSGGKEHDLLQANMQAYLGLAYCMPCANGSDALEIALRALKIGPGDEVIVPAITCVASAEAVCLVGAKPVFCDCDEHGLMDLTVLPSLISPETKVIMPVHLYGMMVDMDRLMEIAASRQLWVVEDAAQSFGSVFQGKAAGSIGDIGCYSFYPTKNLGALGEAGMLATNNPELAEEIGQIINHGQRNKDEHVSVGRNSRMDSLQAGFLNVKLDYFPAWQAKRKELAKTYLLHLQHIDGLLVPNHILGTHHNAHLFVIRTNFRDELKLFLELNDIGTAIHYPLSLPEIPPYGAFGPLRKNAELLCKTILSLPLHPYLSEQEVQFISMKIAEFFKNRSANVRD